MSERVTDEMVDTAWRAVVGDYSGAGYIECTKGDFRIALESVFATAPPSPEADWIAQAYMRLGVARDSMPAADVRAVQDFLAATQPPARPVRG